MRTKEICRLIDVAYSWHGGGGSPLYSFASTMTVHSDEHRLGLSKEIAGCMDIVAKPGIYPYRSREVRRLSSLSGLINGAKNGKKLVTSEQMTAYWDAQR